uniref:calponin homology domain-containing protein DDB_G0272472-like isoform X2 n=1 Tax=Doryrhamphus excisus TaxID=161450 RepID=UPI0025ADA2EC|nr:calponin homology domain-containing protein DDB_G0272472-like isoform X2 [Doryrhamphus excisus]
MDRYGALDLDLECDGGDVSSKAALFGGMFKKSSKSTEPSAQAQDNLSISSDLSKSSDSLNDNAKEKGGMFKGMFKKNKSSKEAQPHQVMLSQQNPELSASNDSLDSKSSKDKPGVFGTRKRPHKPGHTRRPSQDLLDIDFSASNNNGTESTKESSNMFSGIFKKSPKRAQSQDDLSESSDLSGGNNGLSVNNNATKEATGMFSGMFKKSPKPLKERTKSQDNLTVDTELSASSDSLIEKPSKGCEKDKSKGSKENLTEKDKSKQNGFSAMMKNAFYPDKQEKDKTGADVEETLDNGDNKQSKLAGAMTKLNPFKSANKDKQSDSSDEDTPASSDKPSTHKQNAMAGAISKLNPFRPANKKDTEDTETLKEPEKQMEGKPKALKPTVDRERKQRSETPPLARRPAQEEKSGTQTEDKVKTKASEDAQANKDLMSQRNEAPKVPPKKPSDEVGGSKEKPKVKQNGFSAMMKSALYSDKQEKADADVEETSDNGENQASHKQSKFAEAMTKLNPFKSKDKQSDSSDEDTPTDRSSSNKQADKDVLSRQKADKEAPKVPSQRPSQEELRSRAANPRVQKKQENQKQRQSDEETPKDDAERREGDEANPEGSILGQKKTKRHNPFMTRAAAKQQSDKELKDTEEKEEESTEEKEKEDASNKPEQVKVKKPKRHNPFMPRVKAKVAQKNAQDEENEGGNRCLFERLEEFRIDPSQPEDGQDMDGLMQWWNTVESWEDTPQDEDMTEKEEAKAFAVTAEKVQKGIRVFNKLFSERAESLWQHVIDLNGIADSLDKFNKNTKIAQITGGSTSAIGGVATIAGLALAPVTFGTSLIVTAVGLGVATAGGLTSAGAGISNQVNNSMDRKKVEKIVEDYQEKMVDLNKCLKFIKQGIENLRRFDLIKMKNNAYNRDFPVLSTSFYEDGAMAGKAILINANEIMRVVQIANVAGSTAARAVQIASMATGVLTGLFVGMDIYFVAKDSKELKKGAKSEFAGKIREVATQLHEGLVELNAIREELQCTTTPEDGEEDNTASDEKKNEYNYDSSEEDEIDRIKKAIKKDLDNREYV